MPKMNGTGPEGKGSGSGRGLGKCRPHTSDELLEQLGKGQAKRRNTSGGEGKGRRLRYNQQNNQK
ncbi:DUF5320 family protein [Roseimarinus sediminis]|jgi:hypothetical protein|uniref:DUF5320 family protein n=1 Tax=Roseimarinus sediminis TaxID=1610899 RepID=UPI003D22DE00